MESKEIAKWKMEGARGDTHRSKIKNCISEAESF